MTMPGSPGGRGLGVRRVRQRVDHAHDHDEVCQRVSKTPNERLNW